MTLGNGAAAYVWADRVLIADTRAGLARPAGVRSMRLAASEMVVSRTKRW
jgi:hypothetical protein